MGAVSARCQQGKHSAREWHPRRIVAPCYGWARDVVERDGHRRYVEHPCSCDCHRPLPAPEEATNDGN